jgi:2'-5' RNA ligase
VKNAHAFPQVYDRLGIDLRSLGCLMLNTETPVQTYHGGTAYISSDPKKFWIQGMLDHWHVTVRYGFLDGVAADDIDAVLAEVDFPKYLKLTGTEVFESPYETEQYECLVARVEDESLEAVNTALSVLPNVNTFPEYKAHITIGYFLKGQSPAVALKDVVKTLDLNYGERLPRL